MKKNDPFSVRKFAQFFLLLVPTLTGFTFGKAPTWESINTSIDTNFPHVKNMTTQTLLSLQGKKDFILIDVREKEEFSVSRIAGAINIENPEKINLPLESKVIIYCSVGYRSAKFADILRKKGFKDVWNLRGSIFEWANTGYPLTDGKNSTRFVHPYNQKWGALLKPELHKYSEDKKK